MLTDLITLDKQTIDEILEKPIQAWIKSIKVQNLAIRSGRQALLQDTVMIAKLVAENCKYFTYEAIEKLAE